MLPAVWAVLRVYSPYIVFPFAVLIGTIGYNLESVFSDRQIGGKQTKQSIDKERSERLLKQMESTDATDVESLKKNTFVPKSIFDSNVSPSLRTNSQNN